MGIIKIPQRAKLIIGLLAKDISLFEKVEEFFIAHFGDIDFRSKILPFDYTDYYEKEMGKKLKRRFVSFKNLISQEDISKIKIKTNILEKDMSLSSGSSSKREVNIDPGYITDAKLVLATAKDYAHRIYLDNGVFAEVTLSWKGKSYEPLPWTYTDYKTKEYIEIFNTIRKKYMEENER
ncbi:MAG: DUF4416 family protein [Candidatus Omnitrophota bacterium]